MCHNKNNSIGGLTYNNDIADNLKPCKQQKLEEAGTDKSAKTCAVENPASSSKQMWGSDARNTQCH